MIKKIKFNLFYVYTTTTVSNYSLCSVSGLFLNFVSLFILFWLQGAGKRMQFSFSFEHDAFTEICDP